MKKLELKKIILEEIKKLAKGKQLMNEHHLGELPSDKLIKMKWNPLTEPEPMNEEDSMNESSKVSKREVDQSIKMIQKLASALVDNLDKYQAAKKAGKDVSKFVQRAKDLTSSKKNWVKHMEELVAELDKASELVVSESTLNEAFATWTIVFDKAIVSGVKYDGKQKYTVTARNTSEAIRKAVKQAGGKDSDWMAVDVKSILKNK